MIEVQLIKGNKDIERLNLSSMVNNNINYSDFMQYNYVDIIRALHWRCGNPIEITLSVCLTVRQSICQHVLVMG